MISEIVADLKARGSNAATDDDFVRDIEEGTSTHKASHGTRHPGTSPAAKAVLGKH